MTQLINSENREIAKQDRSGARTPNDVIRRFPDLDKVVIKAGQIELEGYTSINGGFSVDLEGKMVCKSATMEDADSNLYTIVEDGYFKILDKNNPNEYTQISNTLVGFRRKNGGITTSPMAIYLYDGYGMIEGSGFLYDGENRQLMLENSNLTQYIRLKANDGSGYFTGTITQGSLEELKKNFEKLENALDIVKQTDIYKYNMKNEKETDKKHIGFVIGDNFNYSKEITNDENNGVVLYSMISVLWQAVKEQQKEIEELKKVNK